MVLLSHNASVPEQPVEENLKSWPLPVLLTLNSVFEVSSLSQPSGHWPDKTSGHCSSTGTAANACHGHFSAAESARVTSRPVTVVQVHWQRCLQGFEMPVLCLYRLDIRPVSAWPVPGTAAVTSARARKSRFVVIK